MIDKQRFELTREQKEYQETFDYVLKTLEITRIVDDLLKIREVFQTYIHISKDIYDTSEIDKMWYQHLQNELNTKDLQEYVKSFRDETGSISITYALAEFRFEDYSYSDSLRMNFNQKGKD